MCFSDQGFLTNPQTDRGMNQGDLIYSIYTEFMKGEAE